MNGLGVLAGCALVIAVGCGPPRGPGESASGRAVIQNKGSDTLVNVAQGWAEAYRDVHPDVAVAVSGGGSGTGVAALINGTVDIANSSRQLKQSEYEQARANGPDPIEFVVGYDALAVYVHADNPLETMTIAAVAAIYGEGGASESWSDVGVDVPGCPSGEIVRVSRQNNSGTYAYFREAILGNNDFKLGSRDMHGSKDVVDVVERTACAIGYSGLAYKTEHVKTLCIAADDDSECVSPTMETAVDGSYPIARPLFMYTRGEPRGAIKDYLDWILSDEGQCIIIGKGYAPARPVSCSSGPAGSPESE
jgi:phosphate transport system substrate-binding protein